ncbi:putative DMT superfamily transporter inner membrane protein [Clostridium acetireducens DSM 10703]|uniref:Putative DMT superfamily transporter inner membrane protein n=1 Tax=Clostridium acetireducens DSM 10703 TaxID=1121290 RepID=A0A1E8EZ60_9CLOT|nr:DMT family transporter [Clostridium acetireducens]OFI06165.1 putative DMT superfamily transporter inner membrane protein [Clostridium acetireducens DSM 10703]
MKREAKADLSLLFVTMVWGITFPIMSGILKYIPPFCLIAFRYIISAIIMGIIFYKKIVSINLNVIRNSFYIGLTLFLGTAFQVVGLVYTTPSKSGFITGLNVVLVPIFMALIYKKTPDTKTVTGVILSIIGIAMISLDANYGINKGDIYTMISAVAIALQVIVVDKYAKNIDVISLTFIEFIIVGVFSLFPAVFVEKLNMELNIVSIFSILFMAIFCTIIAYNIQNKMQPYTEPTHAAIIFLGEPVFSAIFSAFIGDKLNGSALIGCAFILISMIVININYKMLKNFWFNKSSK